MSPASYRTAPPRVARTTLPAGEQQAKSRRRDLRLAGPAPAPGGTGAGWRRRDLLLGDQLLGDGDGEGVASEVAVEAGAGVASGTATGILFSASRARWRAAEIRFCASP